MINQVKVVVIGTIGVGKSSLTIRFVHNSFNEFLQSTLGAVYFQKLYTYTDSKNINKQIKYQFWDTAGQQKYRSIAKIYYKDCKVALIVYDITSRQSYQELKIWINQLRNFGPKNTLLVIVGNKLDLVQAKIAKEQVPEKEVLQYAQSIKAIYKKTSAKQGKGLDELFNSISEKLENQPSQDTRTHGLKKRNKRRTQCC